MRLLIVLLSGFLFAACTTSETPPPPPAPLSLAHGADLVGAMHARYADAWYETLTFTQQTIQHHTDAPPDTALWYEYLHLPGRLRIDFAPVEAGNGILFRQDSVYNMQGGTIARAQPQIHPLLLLGFDLYMLPPDTTAKHLETLGFNLATVRDTVWQGRPTYAIGDAHGAQFWVDEERLVFVRMLRPFGQGHLQEVQFNDYEPAGEGWIAPTVLFFMNGTLTLEEYYQDIETGVDLDPALFNPHAWQRSFD